MVALKRKGHSRHSIESTCRECCRNAIRDAKALKDGRGRTEYSIQAPYPWICSRPFQGTCVSSGYPSILIAAHTRGIHNWPHSCSYSLPGAPDYAYLWLGWLLRVVYGRGFGNTGVFGIYGRKRCRRLKG